MAESEEKGLRVRERHRALVRPLVERYHGDSIEARGDESLSTFPTALDAVNCALAIEAAARGDRELNLHVGIHLGDVVVQDGEVSGPGHGKKWLDRMMRVADDAERKTAALDRFLAKDGGRTRENAAPRGVL